MLLAVENPSSAEQAKWMALGSVIMAVLECLRRLTGWLLFRDTAKAEFLRTVMKEMEELRREVKSLKEEGRSMKGELGTLKFELAMERVVAKRQRELKHAYRGILGDAVLIIQLYRAENGQHREDKFRWDANDPEPDTPSSPLLEEMLTQAVKLKLSEAGLDPSTVLGS